MTCSAVLPSSTTARTSSSTLWNVSNSFSHTTGQSSIVSLDVQGGRKRREERRSKGEGGRGGRTRNG